MQQLTPEGLRIVDDVAQRHGVSSDAVLTLLQALIAGNGTMAQFSHPELGGMGQWSLGGMIMVGDMFNNQLKARVDSLCSELSGVLARQPLMAYPAAGQSQSQGQGGGWGQSQGQGWGQSQGQGWGQSQGGGPFDRQGARPGEVSLFVPSGGAPGSGWWGADLGQPSSTGGQNDIRYAYFPAARRLAIDVGGRITVYDTGDHQISGVSQQQSGDASLTFTSQYGLVRVSDLPVVQPGAQAAGSAVPPAARAFEPAPEPVPAPMPEPVPAAEPFRPSPPLSPAGEAETRGEAAPPAPRNTAPAAPSSPPSGETPDDIFAKIERLAGLRDKGILSEAEFAAKKSELLARL